MSKKFFLTLAVIVLLSLSGFNVKAQTPWSDLVCRGAESVVWRADPGAATTDPMPTTDGCAVDPSMGWLITEPWNADPMEYVDRSCLAATWDEGYELATKLNWRNGSAWHVPMTNANNPIVVPCSDVNGPAEMGLTPGENQMEFTRLDETVDRLLELLTQKNITLKTWMRKYSSPIVERIRILLDLGVDKLVDAYAQ
jgi:hypothetical protein